jgi:hypothetical protein
MKTLSNTSIAAIFAVGLTLVIALLLQIPFFADKETQTTGEMFLLRYQLHEKYAPIKPDPHIVFSGIDQVSLDDIGRWPFNRGVHGDFLIALAHEQPKTVGWDIFFTEQEAPSTPPAAPEATSPAPGATPADSNSTPPASAPAPASPDAQPAPANPTPTGTNSAPATPATSPTAAASILHSIPIGADAPSSATNPVSPVPAAPNSAIGTALMNPFFPRAP